MVAQPRTRPRGSATPALNLSPSGGSAELLWLRPGSNRCRCAVCGRFFGSVTAFDKHQRTGSGDVQCPTKDEVRTRGIVRSSACWWYASVATWAGPR